MVQVVAIVLNLNFIFIFIFIFNLCDEEAAALVQIFATAGAWIRSRLGAFGLAA